MSLPNESTRAMSNNKTTHSDGKDGGDLLDIFVFRQKRFRGASQDDSSDGESGPAPPDSSSPPERRGEGSNETRLDPSLFPTSNKGQRGRKLTGSRKEARKELKPSFTARALTSEGPAAVANNGAKSELPHISSSAPPLLLDLVSSGESDADDDEFDAISDPVNIT